MVNLEEIYRSKHMWVVGLKQTLMCILEIFFPFEQKKYYNNTKRIKTIYCLVQNKQIISENMSLSFVQSFIWNIHLKLVA